MAAARHHRRMSLHEDDFEDALFEQLKQSLDVHECVHCRKSVKAAIPCHGHCGHAYYCSTDCLVFHSRTHRHQCLHHLESDASLHGVDSDDDDDDDDDLPPFLNSAIDSILRQLQHEAVIPSTP
ncbi:hypothetical protein AaE_010572 [Aphanomyces astaci]|uniref:MYND-type domain-containing protein n=2 Tax=Aphanomyces astaci TaxID=112090 RepID=A0A6A4ZZE0_APHAT|nr:hypothetical protein AaE_010572 [Aphanomyces astaci]